MWGSSNELKLRKAENDKSRMENMVLEDKLKSCQRSKRSLTEQLRKTEENMLIIIDQYKEKVNLTTSHGQMLEDEQAKESLTEQLRKTKENMLIIIDQYKEKVNLATSHGQMLEDEQAKVSAL